MRWKTCALCSLPVFVAYIAPWLVGNSPTERVGPILSRPTAAHWLGTDELGRDVLSRLCFAGRTSLTIGIGAALASALIGAVVGLVAGCSGRWMDATLMRLTDLMLSLPALPLLLILAAVDLEKPLECAQCALGKPEWDLPALAHSPWLHGLRLVLVLTLFGWMTMARLVRAQVVGLRDSDFVLAARGLGVSEFRIGVRHLLPHCWGPLLVATATALAANILSEAVLGFLGLGVPPPTPTWGGMLQSARVYSYYRAPWLIYFPGVCITLSVCCANLIAEELGTTRRSLAH